MSGLASIEEVQNAVQELSEAIPKISQLSQAQERVIQSAQWLQTGIKSRWNVFLNATYSDDSQPAHTPNYVAEEVVRKKKEGNLGISEYITLYAVGLLGMARVLNTALASAREQLSENELLYYQALVLDNRTLLQEFEDVYLSIHADPCHWPLEFAQDDANLLIKQGQTEKALEVIDAALSQYPLDRPLSSWDFLAGTAAKGVLLARKGQAEKEVGPALRGLFVLLSIFPAYNNVDRILAVAKIVGKLSAQATDSALHGSQSTR